MSRNMEQLDQDHEAFSDLAAAFALNALDDFDAATFRRHLTTCAQCRESVAEYGAVARLLPVTLAERDASPSLRHRILETARTERPTGTESRQERGRERRWGAPIWLVPLAALLVLTAVSGYWGFQLRTQLDEQRQVLRLQEQALAAIATGAPTWSLRGTEQAPQATAVVVQEPGNQAPLLIVRNLPSLPADRTYQVWVIAGNTPVGAGLLTPGRDSVQITRLDRSVANADMVALTIEPAGGSRAPTGAIVIAGEV